MSTVALIGAVIPKRWAQIAGSVLVMPTAAGGIASAEAAKAYAGVPMLIYHGEKDSIVSPATSRRAGPSPAATSSCR